MIKSLVNILISVVFLSFISASQATPITNLTQAELDARDYTNAEDQLSASLLGINYINYKGYDWAWASTLNIEDASTLGNGQINTLYAPELQENWVYADEILLNILRTELTVADFTNQTTQTIIQATQFFNSDYISVDLTQFSDGKLTETRSEWASQNNLNFLEYQISRTFDTFYVRPSQVPEPSTMMIFALGLIALVSKKRLFS